MSEKINELCDQLMKKFEAVEGKLNAAEAKFENATHDAVHELRTKHPETKLRIAQLKSNANEKFAELKQKVAAEGKKMEADFDANLEVLRDEFERDLDSTHEAWHQTLADLTGGTIL